MLGYILESDSKVSGTIHIGTNKLTSKGQVIWVTVIKWERDITNYMTSSMCLQMDFEVRQPVRQRDGRRFPDDRFLDIFFLSFQNTYVFRYPVRVPSANGQGTA